jgi:hypothetical protein
LEVLGYVNFPRHWRDWTSIILSSVGTKVLLNGKAGRRICHTHGVGGCVKATLCLLYMLFVITKADQSPVGAVLAIAKHI